jgi:hypothetical protein
MIQSIVDGLDLHCAFARVLFPELENLSDDEINNRLEIISYISVL